MTDLKKKNVSDLPAFASDIRALLKDPKSLPPIETWRPERIGEIDIQIRSSGEWFYQGNKMERHSVVQLLSTILLKEDGAYYLVSPSEKLKLDVEDVPFVIEMMDIEGEGEQQCLHFSTQMGDCFTLSPEHTLRVSYNEKGEPRPYVHVRNGLEARLSRSVYYELAEKIMLPDAQENNTLGEDDLPAMGVWSAGKFFTF